MSESPPSPHILLSISSFIPFINISLLIYDLQSKDWINTYYILKGFLKARRPHKVSNEIKCTNEKMTWNTQHTNLSSYVPKTNVDHTIISQGTGIRTLDHSATTPRANNVRIRTKIHVKHVRVPKWVVRILSGSPGLSGAPRVFTLIGALMVLCHVKLLKVCERKTASNLECILSLMLHCVRIHPNAIQLKQHYFNPCDIIL